MNPEDYAGYFPSNPLEESVNVRPKLIYLEGKIPEVGSGTETPYLDINGDPTNVTRWHNVYGLASPTQDF